MCDTFVKYDTNRLFFGKNSDRSPNEPNLILFIPAHRREPANEVECTYRSVIAQADARAVLLVKPSWIWGAEMGINDAGVMIGNEAVFTKSKGKKTPKLLGMDLLRLALEEADSSRKGVDIIIHYLEKYGQGGNSGFDKAFYYDNSFLVADQKEAYLLETSGNHWVAKKVDDRENISNRLTLSNDYTLANISDNMRFSKTQSEPVFTFFSRAKERETQVCERLKNANSVTDFISLLSSHQESNRTKLFLKGSVSSVCMHKSLLGDQTTASFLVESDANRMTIWLSGSSSPCLGLYIPVFFGDVQPPVFTDCFQSLTYWLDREWLHRAIYSNLIDIESYLSRRNELQASFIEKEAYYRQSPINSNQLATFTRECHEKEQALIETYRDLIEQIRHTPSLLKSPWNKRSLALGKHPFAPTINERKMP